QVAMPGPRAVRSIRAPREDVSVLKGVTVMMVLAIDHETDQEDRYLALGNSYEGVVVRGRMETGSWRNGTDEISKRTKRLLTSIAANARSEPKAVIVFLCCARTQRENRFKCILSDAIAQRENRPLDHRAARIVPAIHKSRR
ncbi:MAG: hypothetical protein AAF498_08690, partial [Pseudomonadota bacterium]